jgi:hypothetical protein
VKVPVTKQQAAINAAQTVTGLMQQMITLYHACDNLNKSYNSEGYSTTWAAMPTAAQNADGSIGATDGTPGCAWPPRASRDRGINHLKGRVAGIPGFGCRKGWCPFQSVVETSTTSTPCVTRRAA